MSFETCFLGQTHLELVKYLLKDLTTNLPKRIQQATVPLAKLCLVQLIVFVSETPFNRSYVGRKIYLDSCH